MTDEQLAEIERAWSQATPEQWDFACFDDTFTDDDARAIASATEHVRTLLAEVRRLREEVERLRPCAEAMASGHEHGCPFVSGGR